MNCVTIVGRVSGLEIKETENGGKITRISVAVSRNFKNINGEYDKDFIPCVLWSGITEKAAEYFQEGDLIGIKGRLQSKENKIEVVAEKVTFLSSGSKKED